MSIIVRRLHRGLMLAATLALLFSFLVYLLYAINLIPFPFDYDQGEGFELRDAVLFSQGQLPYRDTEVYPFYSSNYPPLYHLLGAPLVWIFGPAYWYGRILSFLASLVSACAIGYAVYRDGHRHLWLAALSGLAFLASNFVYHIGPLFRQHTLMVALETAAIVILARAFPGRDKRGIALGLLLLICAGYTKQLAAITAVAAFAWMFLRQPRAALPWAAAFIGFGALIFLWLNLASNGHWWTQTIVANVNQFHPFQAFGLFVLWFQLHGFLLVPAGLLICYETYFDRLSIYAIWFLFTALLGGIASGAWGAGDSYFTTSIAAACILSGICLSRSLKAARRSPPWLQRVLDGPAWPILLLAPLLYLGYARATLKMPTGGAFAPLASFLRVEPNTRESFYDSASFDVPGYANIGYFVSEEDEAAGRRIVDLIKESEGPVLSEEAGFAFLANRDVVSNPTQLRNLYLAGSFHGDRLIEMIETYQFGLVILRAQFYPTPILQAIGRAYEHWQTVRMNRFDYLILRPKSGASE
ncbi:MAG: hypothetical protein OXG39_10125 [Chloroflexi bacterium]|nr:hypothetical protein [Chloroflexota bacterium]